ncbi:hypothetical protein [Agrococcus jejuensis]|uniref:DUF4352 domain-containing protein n=1 Tax=Agrococcus jejuensis TaxID=399736 RepID=A0A1G8CSQ9_9MICO|nr:hypothetical protein [Agrococcus jejuensis]SDH47990.1 hypothetical protein SAMN04489720_1384 [Agrococcus jejuensis]
MPARRAPLLATIVAAAALGLTACIPTPPAVPTETPETTAPETSSAPAESEEAEEEQPASAPGEAAAPGSEFAFGEYATVELINLDDQAQLVEITVTGVRTGSVADFEAAGLDQEFLDQLEGYTPLYVDVEMRQVAPMTAALEYDSIYIDFGGLDQADRALQDISIFGSFEPCDTASIDPEFDSGTPHTTCFIVATAGGDELAGISYGPYDTVYDDYDGEPLVWRP